MPSITASLLAIALCCASHCGQAWAKEKTPVAPRAPARSELTPAGAGWVKVCFDDPQTRRQTCYTTRDFAEEGGTPILSLEVFETKGEDLMMVRVFLPLGLALKPGVRIGFEREEPESGAFEACFPAGCYASSNVPSGFVEAMRRGGRFLISVKKLSGEELGFLLPLEGFGRASDGPGAGPEDLHSERAKRLQDELSEKVAAERRKAEESAAKPPPADSTAR